MVNKSDAAMFAPSALVDVEAVILPGSEVDLDTILNHDSVSTDFNHTFGALYYKAHVAQWVERRPRDPMDSMIRGSNSVRSTRKIC